MVKIARFPGGEKSVESCHVCGCHGFLVPISRLCLLSKTQQGVDKRGQSRNPVEHKRREKDGFGRELLVPQKPSFGQSACKPRERLSKAGSRQTPPNPPIFHQIPPSDSLTESRRDHSFARGAWRQIPLSAPLEESVRCKREGIWSQPRSVKPLFGSTDYIVEAQSVPGTNLAVEGQQKSLRVKVHVHIFQS